MNKLLKTSSLGAAILAALLPLFCCWGPTLLAGVAVLSGAATNMAWLHPYEPWLYALSFTTLGYSHFRAHKKRQEEAAACKVCTTNEVTTNSYASITLWLATGLVIIMFLINQFPEWFV